MASILNSIAEHWQSIGLIILSAVGPGAAGGLVAHFINNELVAHNSVKEQPDKVAEKKADTNVDANREESKPTETPRSSEYRFESIFQSLFIGMCGGVAFIFFVTAIGGIRDFTDPSEIARFISISMIAGFGARRLLPMMVTHLEKQIAHAEQSAERALNTAKGVLDQLENAQKRMSETEQNMKITQRKLELVRINANLLSSAHASAPKSTRERAVSEATAVLAEIGDATNHDQSLPAIFINLARLHRASGNLDEAIDLLERFVLKADQGELVANTNVSVAYYNLACYRALKKNADLDRAMSDLEKSIRLSQNPADDMRYARGDADLDPLKEMKRFKDLLKRFIDRPPEDQVD